MSSNLIAIIAEDETDCDVFRQIIHRVLGTNTRTKSWASKSSSTLKRKLSAKLKVMTREGCDAFIIVHDLDRNPKNNSLNDEKRLRDHLELICSNINGIRKYICIPIEELEAWFWSDSKIIKEIGGEKCKANPNPHQIKSPKEALKKLSIGKNGKPSYGTNRNAELAKKLDMVECSKYCPSFRELVKFLRSL